MTFHRCDSASASHFSPQFSHGLRFADAAKNSVFGGACVSPAILQFSYASKFAGETPAPRILANEGTSTDPLKKSSKT